METFETIMIELPGTINLSDIINEDLISKKLPKIKITIREKTKHKNTFLEYS